MDKKKLIYFAFSFMLMLPACTQEISIDSEQYGDARPIFFRSYLPEVDLSRATVITTDNFNTCQVTSFNPDDNDYIDSETGDITTYFHDAHFEKAADGRFLATDQSCRWPNSEHTLHFFAYYPAADSMRNAAGQDHFNLRNASKQSAGKSVIDYRLEDFRVATDIADHSDFLTAYTTGILTKDAEEGIKFDFKHQLARIEISAWSGNDKYDFEIAGVRIGNPLVEADFNFSALMSGGAGASPWLHKSTQAPVEHIFGEGETIVKLSNKSGLHNTETAAASLMGAAGAAMVLPTPERIEAWEGKAGMDAPLENYKTDKMYFSVLLRATNNAGEVAYPYPNDKDGMDVIYLAVDKEGKVTRRLYKDGDSYYTSTEKSEETIYTPDSGETIQSFGWAALPLPAKWDAGKIYTYKLNYSSGIGWHDPADPDPGEPIIERGQIPFEVKVEEWVKATDYNSDIDVPKREL